MPKTPYSLAAEALQHIREHNYGLAETIMLELLALLAARPREEQQENEDE